MVEPIRMPRRSFLGVAGAVGALGAATMLGGMRRLPALASTVPAPLFGAWQPGAPWDGSSRSFAAIDGLEAGLGTRLDILHWYAGWAHADRPDADLIRSVIARGSLPLVTWEPWDYRRGPHQPEYAPARIAGGDFDAYVDGWARDIAALGLPVYLRLAHEMDGEAYPWCAGRDGNTPAQSVAAWQRVVSRFRAAGATNARFVWCPNVTWDGSTRPAYDDLFPGDDYVDVVGLDGYNGGRDLDWGGWQSFAEVFDHSLARIARLSSRPVWLCEVGCAEAGGSKADWIAGMWAGLAARPRISGIVWFNEAREADWRLDSSAAARQAMREGLAGR